MRNAIEIADKSNLTFFNKRQNNHDHPEKKIFQTKLINNYNLFLTINTNYQLKTLIKTTTNEEAQNSINNQNHKKQIMGREKKDDDFANEDDIEMIEEAEKITKKPTTKKKSTTNKKQKDISIEITTTPQSQTTPNTQSPQPTSTQLNMKAFKTSKEVFAAVANLGVTKSTLPWYRLFVLAIMAGTFMGLGTLISLKMGSIVHLVSAPLAPVAAAAVFPISLMFITVVGAELFTGNTMFISLAWYTRQISLLKLGYQWVIVFIGNLIGAVFCAFLLGWLTDLFITEDSLAYVNGIANGKMNLGWGVLIVRGIGCSTLVTLAISMTIASEDIISKLAGIWFPLFTLNVLGFEHAVPNMAFVPLSMMLGNDIGFGTFLWRNLLPVTIGNTIGGSIVVGLTYWFVYLFDPKTKISPSYTSMSTPPTPKPQQQQQQQQQKQSSMQTV